MNNYYFQFGGMPDWYNEFDNDLIEIYNKVQTKTGNLVLTGSAAISFLLKNLNMEDKLYSMNKPNDLDLMYTDSNISHPEIPNFNISTTSLVKSITYNRINDRNVHSINSFDLIFVPPKENIYYITVNGIDIIHPASLLSEYL